MATQFFNTAGSIEPTDYPSATCRNSTGNFTASELCTNHMDRANIFCFDNISTNATFSLPVACDTILRNEAKSFRVAICQLSSSLSVRTYT